MHKTNLKNKKASDPLFNSIAIILIIFSINIPTAHGGSNNWIEVSKTQSGIQYWDRYSLINKDKGVIEIATKYLEIDVNSLRRIDENIYIMEINCLTNKYKDVSANGKTNFKAKWKDPNNDKLINDVITESCNNV